MSTAFSIMLSNDQELTPGVLTEIQPPFFVSLDEGGCIRNGHFEAPEDGIYHFDISLGIWFGTHDPNIVFMEVYKNSADIVATNLQFAKAYNPGRAPNLSMSFIVKLTAGDEITIRVMHLSSPNTRLCGRTTTFATTTFSGFKIT